MTKLSPEAMDAALDKLRKTVCAYMNTTRIGAHKSATRLLIHEAWIDQLAALDQLRAEHAETRATLHALDLQREKIACLTCQAAMGQCADVRGGKTCRERLRP
jgi:hypothetical protein